jgi:nucleotide-binding universal stress UspA family protein
VNSRQRDRIVDREVMKLELRAARRRSASGHAQPTKDPGRPRLVLVAVDANDSSAAAATVAAAGILADALGAEVILAGAAGPAVIDVARQEHVDLVVVSTRGDADHYVLDHSEVPVLVVPVEPPTSAAA